MSPMAIHPQAEGFGAVAAEYERGRPGYPPAAVEWLLEQLGVGPGSRLVDLGAGTGKLTRQLAGRGAVVLAVEPVPAMRAALAAAVRGVEVLEGSAESIGLEDRSVDALVVGQAFHWFATDVALAEIHRVLRPGGRLGLIWNRRDVSQPLQAELGKLFATYRGDTPSHASGEWRRVLQASASFGPLHEASFTLDQVLDTEGLVARGLSMSFVATLTPDARHEIAERLRAIARDHGEPIVLRYGTECYSTQARSPSGERPTREA
jgi:SAM-dependent methyltransferase